MLINKSAIYRTNQLDAFMRMRILDQLVIIIAGMLHTCVDGAYQFVSS